MPTRNLKLKRPLIVFDLETTGLDIAQDRIVEIACVKLLPDGQKDIRTRRINPLIPISPTATAVHGISDADVKDAPTFKQVATHLLSFFENSDLSGFNIEHFDLPLLRHEFERVDMKFPTNSIHIVDSCKIFIKKEPRDLSAAYHFYCQKELTDAHTAEADAMAAADVLVSQIQRYEDLPQDVDELHAFCHPRKSHWIDPDGKIVWKNNEAVFAFGKFRDRPLRQVAIENPDYLEWIKKANFSTAVIELVQSALQGEFPKPLPETESGDITNDAVS